MFDISFSEILVIAAVALVVLGPERLPKVARTLGHLLGRAQRYANDVKNDIEREMELEELRKWQNSVEGAARSVETSIRAEMSQFQETLQTGPQDSSNAPFDPKQEAATEPASIQNTPAAVIQTGISSTHDSTPGGHRG